MRPAKVEAMVVISSYGIGWAETTAEKTRDTINRTQTYIDSSVKFENDIILINVEEAPLIENININGLKANKYKELVRKKFSLKPRSSYNEIILIQDVKSIESTVPRLMMSSTKTWAKVPVTVPSNDVKSLIVLDNFRLFSLRAFPKDHTCSPPQKYQAQLLRVRTHCTSTEAFRFPWS